MYGGVLESAALRIERARVMISPGRRRVFRKPMGERREKLLPCMPLQSRIVPAPVEFVALKLWQLGRDGGFDYVTGMGVGCAVQDEHRRRDGGERRGERRP